MTRTDVHRPSALVTEDYEFVACGWYGATGDPGYSPLAHKPWSDLITEGWTFGGEGGGGCDHCGAHLRYYAILKHMPTHTLIRVGETCLGNRFELASSEFHKLRTENKLNRERVALKSKRKEFLSKGDNQAAYDFAKEKVNDEFLSKFARYIDKYGTASEKFTAAVLKNRTRSLEYEAKRADERANGSPVVEGKGIVIEGEIVKTDVKWYGDDARSVMTVKDDRGFRVWGTVPAGITDSVAGDRVRFKATVEASDRDEYFGFFKRPTQAERI